MEGAKEGEEKLEGEEEKEEISLCFSQRFPW